MKSTIEYISSWVPILGVAAAVLLWVDGRYMNAIREAVVELKIYHTTSDINDLRNTSALYRARLEDNGELSPGDANRYQNLLTEIASLEEAKRLLEVELAEL